MQKTDETRSSAHPLNRPLRPVCRSGGGSAAQTCSNTKLGDGEQHFKQLIPVPVFAKPSLRLVVVRLNPKAPVRLRPLEVYPCGAERYFNPYLTHGKPFLSVAPGGPGQNPSIVGSASFSSIDAGDGRG